MKLQYSEWSHWENVFVNFPESPWSSRHVSVDMLKQFFMGQVTQAVMNEIVLQRTCVASSNVREDVFIWETKPDKISDFFELICNYEVARSFLDNYAY